MRSFQPTIGLEIHAELKTKSKMFCACPNDPFTAAPNTNICPICLGLPGTLPFPNRRAVELTITVGRALQCQVAAESKFDRKNYFYPDLPKGYQISQYDQPLSTKGFLMVEGKKVGVRRVHLEEDTGKLLHQEKDRSSLVDYNRAGVPLIELVTEPVITSPREAVAFAKELQIILRHLGASDADMEKGQLRVEANVSVKKPDGELGTKVEIKNLNSFRSVERAIAYEIDRHSKLLEDGQEVIQETRGWDEKKGTTFSQRVKEEAEDYRYFPEPDIPPLRPPPMEGADFELPEDARATLRDMGLSAKDAQIIVSDPRLYDFIGEVMSKSRVVAKTVANWIINEGIDPSWGVESAARLIAAVESGELTAPMAKQAIKKAKQTGKLVIPRGIQVISDHGKIDSIIDGVIAQHPAAVADFREGKKEALDFLVGQVMRETKGQADPQTVNKLLQGKLSS